jgi:3'-5' exoribonuclease
MAATTELCQTTPIREWRDGLDVDAVVLVRGVERRHRRDGAPYLKLLLGDRTGLVPGVMWDADASGELPDEGAPARVLGRCADDPRYGRRLTVSAMHAVHPADVAWDTLLDGPCRPVAELEDDLDDLLHSISDPHLGRLTDALLGSQTLTGRRFRAAPAAKYNHHAYRHGLLEHSVDVARGASALSSVFGLNRDLAVCGALLHDIGKLDAYEADGHAVDLGDAGKLLGEIPLGYHRVRAEIERRPDFPPELAQHLLHIVLSHHGRLEFGSPVVPCTREAVLVHTVDNLSGQMGAFDRLEKETDPGARWSGFDRVLDTAACFGVASGAG